MRAVLITWEPASRELGERPEARAIEPRDDPIETTDLNGQGDNGVFTTRPVASTYHFSLGNGLPPSVAAIQSAMRTGGKGPRFVAGTLPTECRESWYTTS